MQGDVADTVYYIQKGNIKLTVISKHDKEAVVGVLGPGQFFGEGCMNGHPMRIAPRPRWKAASLRQSQNRP
jgi:CRP/FNR family cyclic AMP-dependent transcriptional regulator